MRYKIGDYVLATKYADGDPCDHFCIGFIKSFYVLYGQIRFIVVDSDGNPFRATGFRRVKRISSQEGSELLKLFPEIGNIPGRSLWSHLNRIRKELKR